MIHSQGNLRGEKVWFENGEVWYCVWHPLPGSEQSGMCFGFSEEDAGSLVDLVKRMIMAEPDVWVEPPEAKPGSRRFEWFRRIIHDIGWRLIAV